MNFDIKLFEDKERGTMAALANDTHISKWCMDQQSIVSDQTVPLHILPFFNEGFTVVDVGAFIGDHTVAYAERVGPSGRVLAFEPYLPSFVCLAFNCRNMPQVELYHCALGAEIGTGYLTLPHENNMGTISLGSNHNAPFRNVELATIDFFNLQSCAFIKIDVEGLEPNVLIGAMQTIRRFKPFMYVELNDAALGEHGYVKQDVLDIASMLGYTHEFANPNHSLNDVQVDVILRPK